MGRQSGYTLINSLNFAIYGINYVSLRDLEHDGVIVPKGYVFDGVTVRAPFTFIFSNENLRQGIRASCFHDWICEHRSEYTRKYATDLLVEVWKQDGLSPFKASLVKISVNVYQFFKGGWKNENGSFLDRLLYSIRRRFLFLWLFFRKK